jgi:hypothetical protein
VAADGSKSARRAGGGARVVTTEGWRRWFREEGDCGAQGTVAGVGTKF